MSDPGEQPQRVVVTDIRMPFWSMVGFMVKWAIASIPAYFVLVMIGFVFIALFIALFVGVFHVLHPGALSSLLKILSGSGTFAPSAQ